MRRYGELLRRGESIVPDDERCAALRDDLCALVGLRGAVCGVSSSSSSCDRSTVLRLLVEREAGAARARGERPLFDLASSAAVNRIESSAASSSVVVVVVVVVVLVDDDLRSSGAVSRDGLSEVLC